MTPQRQCNVFFIILPLVLTIALIMSTLGIGLRNPVKSFVWEWQWPWYWRTTSSVPAAEAVVVPNTTSGEVPDPKGNPGTVVTAGCPDANDIAGLNSFILKLKYTRTATQALMACYGYDYADLTGTEGPSYSTGDDSRKISWTKLVKATGNAALNDAQMHWTDAVWQEYADGQGYSGSFVISTDHPVALQAAGGNAVSDELFELYGGPKSVKMSWALVLAHRLYWTTWPTPMIPETHSGRQLPIVLHTAGKAVAPEGDDAVAAPQGNDVVPPTPAPQAEVLNLNLLAQGEVQADVAIAGPAIIIAWDQSGTGPADQYCVVNAGQSFVSPTTGGHFYSFYSEAALIHELDAYWTDVSGAKPGIVQACPAGTIK